MKRGETSGSIDDDEESIRKRFGVVFEPYHFTDLFTHAVIDKETTTPVIQHLVQHYKKLGKVAEVCLKSS